MKIWNLSLFLATAAALTVPSAWASDDDSEDGYRIKVTGKNCQRIRQVMGAVTDSVQGIPAEPVDSFAWDGVGVEKIDGRVTIEVNPVMNTGRVKAKWRDEHGRWTYEQRTFAPPPHGTGLSVSPDSNVNQSDLSGDPITTNAYLHGNTMNGGAVLPTVPNLVTTWGPARVKLNGDNFNNPYDGPTPLWFGHSMTTVGVRDADGTVRNQDGSIYNSGFSSQGARDEDDWEVHLVFHDADVGPMANNIPPIFSFFYHIQCENVSVGFEQADDED